MKIKNKIYALLVFVVIGLFPVSCTNDLLEQVNPNTISTITFWRNADDAEVAVNGMYHPITSVFFWGRVMHSGPLTRTDAMNIRPGGTNTGIALFLGGAGVRHSENPWFEAYKTIFRANSILENVNEENVADTATRNGILGQAYFMRSFAYWYLVNLYGNVPAGEEGGIPLVLNTPDPNNNEELFPSQATAIAVWDQIISDLEQAESTLPDSWPPTDLGRPTKWTATALKGKTHLYRSGFLGVDEYGQAETAFKAVVASGAYSLLPGTQYGENFSQVNENNVESVFELQMHPIGDGNFTWGSDIPLTGTQGHFVIEYAPPSISPDNGHVINPWVKNLFEANGETVRRDASIAYDYPGSMVNVTETFNEGLAADIELVNGPDGLASLPGSAGLEPIFTRKYSGMELPRGGTGFLGDNYGPNWRIIRYSDVLLMLAEALNEQSKTAEAEGFLNQVRTRAAVAPKTGLDEAGMRQAIIDERTLELLGEGHRFFDLLRWGLADTYLGQTSAHEGPHPRSLGGESARFETGKHELIPLPVQEVTANPNLKQNPGY